MRRGKQPRKKYREFAFLLPGHKKRSGDVNPSQQTDFLIVTPDYDLRDSDP